MKIIKTLYLKAPREHVWRYLTEKDKLATWFHEAGEDLRDGGPFALVSNSPGREGERLCWGDVIEFDPPAKLVHSFTHDHLKGAETRCEWRLESAEGGTILTLIHEGFEAYAGAPFPIAADHDAGWDEHFARLRRVVA